MAFQVDVPVPGRKNASANCDPMTLLRRNRLCAWPNCCSFQSNFTPSWSLAEKLFLLPAKSLPNWKSVSPNSQCTRVSPNSQGGLVGGFEASLLKILVDQQPSAVSVTRVVRVARVNGRSPSSCESQSTNTFNNAGRTSSGAYCRLED
eukprot:963847-Rhodomonas_salina.1